MLATWPEKVERLISIDCRSPMSASTWSKTGSAAVSAGGRSPAWWRSAARPRVFSATVLPPVLGPLITSARRLPRSRSIGTAERASSSGWRAAASRTSSDDLDRCALPAAREGAERHRQVDLPRRLDRCGREAVPPRRRSAESSRRIRSTSSRSALVASDWRLESSTTSNGSTKRVWPESDASWTIPGTLRRALALTASTGRPPRRVMNSSCRCSRSSLERTSCSSLSRTRCRPVRSSPRSLRSFGEALSRRSEPSSSTARSIALATCARAGSIARPRARAGAVQPPRRARRGHATSRWRCPRRAAAPAARARLRARRGPPGRGCR